MNSFVDAIKEKVESYNKISMFKAKLLVDTSYSKGETTEFVSPVVNGIKIPGSPVILPTVIIVPERLNSIGYGRVLTTIASAELFQYRMAELESNLNDMYDKFIAHPGHSAVANAARNTFAVMELDGPNLEILIDHPEDWVSPTDISDMLYEIIKYRETYSIDYRNIIRGVRGKGNLTMSTATDFTIKRLSLKIKVLIVRILLAHKATDEFRELIVDINRKLKNDGIYKSINVVFTGDTDRAINLDKNTNLIISDTMPIEELMVNYKIFAATLIEIIREREELENNLSLRLASAASGVYYNTKVVSSKQFDGDSLAEEHLESLRRGVYSSLGVPPHIIDPNRKS